MKKVALVTLAALITGTGLFQAPGEAALEKGQSPTANQGLETPAQTLGPGIWVGPALPQQGPSDSEQDAEQHGPPDTPTPTPPAGPLPQERRQAPQTVPPAGANAYDSLLEKAAQQGTVRVIVGLDAPFRPEGTLSAPQADRQRADIDRAQEQALDKIQRGQARLIKKFKFIPYLVLEVDREALEQLMALGEVTGIQEDVPERPLFPGGLPPSQEGPERPFLSDSIPLIGVDNVFNSGITGSGQTVAILDTGVDKTHSFLSGKVVSEACYSTNSPAFSATTMCPNGLEEDTNVGSGVNCPPVIFGCDHGTHVAGISAGNGSTSTGVAKDANIIAIQVFSRIDSPMVCNQFPDPCALTFPSDHISALERVFELRDTFDIAAVNMSLGGGTFSSACDTDFRKPAVDNLRSVGIVTVAATGNQFFGDAIASPACISTVVSVGATDNSDNVPLFSNCASIMDLYAPGVSINSSVPGGDFALKDGTSMATPHVAGAWALARSKSPQATIDDILAAFVNTGVPITDPVCPTKPRIQVDSALDQLPSPPTGCAPPASGNWAIPGSQSCTLSQSAAVTGNVVVEQNATLTIPAGTTLDINFSANHLRIKDGARVVIQDGGKIE